MAVGNSFVARWLSKSKVGLMAVAGLALLVVLPTTPATASTIKYAYVANYYAGKVSVINTATNAVVKTVAAGDS